MSFLPKPGAWMLTLKQLMAFPMYATTMVVVVVAMIDAALEDTTKTD